MKNKMEHPISRKKIYSVALFLDTLTSIERFLLFPGQNWFFHVSLFIGTFSIIAIVWEFLQYVSVKLEKPFPVATKPLLRIILQVVLTFTGISILGTILFSAAEKYFTVITPPVLSMLMPLLYFLASIILNLIYFGTYYFREWKNNLVRSERLQREQSEVKYDSLRNQLNPHFLFNALTSLNSLIFENQQLASDFLQQLAKVYRYTLQHKNNETVPLKTEIDFIMHYIFLFKTRFDNAINFKIDLKDESLVKGIVPVTLQMLIENAAKHNIITEKNPLQISISTNDQYIEVENNINKKSQVETSNKHGLENLKALYKYLSDLPVEIIETEQSFKVKIPLIEK